MLSAKGQNQTCKCTGYERGCSEQFYSQCLLTTRHHPLSPMDPYCKVFYLSNTLDSLRKFCFFPCLIGQLEFQTSIERSCVLKLSWLNSSQKQRNNGNNDRIVLYLNICLVPDIISFNYRKCLGGDCCNLCCQRRRLNFSFVLKLVIVRTRTQNQNQTTASCSDLL